MQKHSPFCVLGGIKEFKEVRVFRVFRGGEVMCRSYLKFPKFSKLTIEVSQKFTIFVKI